MLKFRYGDDDDDGVGMRPYKTIIYEKLKSLNIYLVGEQTLIILICHARECR